MVWLEETEMLRLDDKLQAPFSRGKHVDMWQVRSGRHKVAVQEGGIGGTSSLSGVLTSDGEMAHVDFMLLDEVTLSRDEIVSGRLIDDPVDVESGLNTRGCENAKDGE